MVSLGQMDETQPIDPNTSEAMDRIGHTHCEQLAWAVRITSANRPESEGAWLKLHYEIVTFAMLAGPIGLPAPIINRDKKRFEENVLDEFSALIRQALEHETIQTKLSQQPGFLMWDEKRQRYFQQQDFYNDDVTKAAARGLAKRIVECGHMLRKCPAPAKRKPGRKAKNQPKISKTIEEACGNVFVAKRRNQKYCSSACLNRIITRRKRSRPKKAIRKAKKKKR